MNRLFQFLLIAFLVSFCISPSADARTRSRRHSSNSSYSTSGRVVQLNSSQYARLVANWRRSPYSFKNRRPVVVDFYATWCGPCQRLAPLMERLAADYKGRVSFYKVDVDECKDLFQSYGFNSMPTVLFIYPNGSSYSYDVGLKFDGFYYDRINSMLR